MKKDSNEQIIPLESEMQALRNGDANAVQRALAEVENNRTLWCVNAIRFGLAALEAKEIVGRGKFGKWLSDALSVDGNARIFGERTAREYIGLAKIYVDKLRGGKSESILDGVRCYCLVNFGDENALEKFDADEVLSDASKTFELLKHTFAGMQPAAMRNLLREGAVQAEEDKKAEDAAAKTLTKRDLKGLGGNGGGQQLDFFSELYNDFRATIEAPRSDRRFSEMPRAEMEQLGNYLIAQGREIVEIAKGKKD